MSSVFCTGISAVRAGRTARPNTRTFTTLMLALDKYIIPSILSIPLFIPCYLPGTRVKRVVNLSLLRSFTTSTFLSYCLTLDEIKYACCLACILFYWLVKIEMHHMYNKQLFHQKQLVLWSQIPRYYYPHARITERGIRGLIPTRATRPVNAAMMRVCTQRWLGKAALSQSCYSLAILILNSSKVV